MKSTEVYTMITGASMGLGKEMAMECARRGRNLILIALQGHNLEQFCIELEYKFRIRAVFRECDLTDEQALTGLAGDIILNFSVDQLINNAGAGGTARFEDASPEYLDNIIHLNIRATTMLTRLLLPELRSHPKALILNVASVAAFGALPYKTIYPASKAFIYSFSRGLSRELHNTGVRVVVLAPGPFISNPDVMHRIMKQGLFARLGVLPAREITKQAISGAENGEEVIVPGVWNKFNRFLIRWVPEYFRLYMMAGILKKELP